MGYVLLLEILAYFGVLGALMIMDKRGQLTENRLALMMVSPLCIIILTALLFVSHTWEGALLAIGITIIFFLIGYPIARWVYRQLFVDK